FKLQNGLQRINMSGEANSAPLETLPEEPKYNEEDIYNADETGLFFRMEPNQTLGTGSHFNPKVFEETNSDLSESDEEEVAESSHSAQNRKKAKKKEADDLQEYFHMLDHDIPTEEHLTYEQIITNY
ncbi:4337_t:CDS:2, partial [Rhizophagus irregularis]